MEELTDRQKQIFDHIVQEINKKGYPPSVREIGKAVGLKSPASVHSHLKTLEKLNYIRRDPSKPRAIEILYKNNKNQENKLEKDMLYIPMVGKVTAGVPVLAEENIDDYFPVPAGYLKNSKKDFFMLEVRGDSMIDAGIHDGDLVIAQKQNHAENGEIVIGLIEDEATVKTYYKEKDHIKLQPENDSYEPILGKNIKVLGKVVGLYRKF
ncbi:MAG TPA: transcriptional repressor LexA [Halanaerobiales bacterium]|nr:transcriptional repressor LexA [Halanaerobiales bacterium]